ncbi:hypothetical protein A176_001043 [Myxococcus hansupus]|uniref:Uncharacterized protein n=1 Tax=Pseudomyxococcus hansupus TaxID=1297742 RepID=A0A0H4WL86_9BACT|nr:hypothetical protein A176_001043 [Myxococcus hansupus]
MRSARHGPASYPGWCGVNVLGPHSGSMFRRVVCLASTDLPCGRRCGAVRRDVRAARAVLLQVGSGTPPVGRGFPKF